MITYVKFKDGEKHPIKIDGEYVESDFADSFQDCGRKIQSNEIDVDIDESLSKESIRKMLETLQIQTPMVWTDRGIHLIFKKPMNTKFKDGICALGFKVEFKTCENLYAITVKRNGVMRTMENEDAEPMELPFVFQTSKQYDQLIGLCAGDGRNSLLYKHKMHLANHDGWQTILQCINEYVFAEPLPQEEFETVARGEAIENQEQNENYFAELMMNSYRCVMYSNRIWFYYQDHYITNDNILKRLIYKRCSVKKTRFIDEIIKQIEYKAKFIEDGTIFDVKFKNGILRNGEWIEIDSKEFTPYYIDIEYHADAEPVKIVDDYIHDLTNGEPEYRNLLLEAIAYPLVLEPSIISGFGRFFLFRGDGANGKSTMLDVMRAIYNPRNCTNMSIKQLVDDRYKTTLRGKLANLGDDIEAEMIDSNQMKILKNITTGDTVMTRELYQQAENITFTTKLYFTTNSDIKSCDKGYAFQRRVLWLPMFNKVKKIDTMFKKKITTPDALSYWIRLIIEAYFRLMQNGQFTVSPIVKEFNERYHIQNDAVQQFILDKEKEREHYFKHMKCWQVQSEFQDWKEANGYQDAECDLKRFKNILWKSYQMKLGTKRIDGIPTKVFLTKDETKQFDNLS